MLTNDEDNLVTIKCRFVVSTEMLVYNLTMYSIIVMSLHSGSLKRLECLIKEFPADQMSTMSIGKNVLDLFMNKSAKSSPRASGKFV